MLALAAGPEDPRHHRLRFGRPFEIPLGLAGSTCFEKRRHRERPEHPFCSPEREQESRPPTIAVINQLERLACGLGGGRPGVERQGPVGRLYQCAGRRLAKRFRVDASRLGNRDRLEVVVCEHFGPVLAAIRGERLDPRRGEAMLLYTGGTRDLVVGDVAYESVQERVLRLAANG